MSKNKNITLSQFDRELTKKTHGNYIVTTGASETSPIINVQCPYFNTRTAILAFKKPSEAELPISIYNTGHDKTMDRKYRTVHNKYGKIAHDLTKRFVHTPINLRDYVSYPGRNDFVHAIKIHYRGVTEVNTLKKNIDGVLKNSVKPMDLQNNSYSSASRLEKATKQAMKNTKSILAKSRYSHISDNLKDIQANANKLKSYTYDELYPGTLEGDITKEWNNITKDTNVLRRYGSPKVVSDMMLHRMQNQYGDSLDTSNTDKLSANLQNVVHESNKQIKRMNKMGHDAINSGALSLNLGKRLDKNLRDEHQIRYISKTAIHNGIRLNMPKSEITSHEFGKKIIKANQKLAQENKPTLLDRARTMNAYKHWGLNNATNYNLNNKKDHKRYQKDMSKFTNAKKNAKAFRKELSNIPYGNNVIQSRKKMRKMFKDSTHTYGEKVAFISALDVGAHHDDLDSELVTATPHASDFDKKRTNYGNQIEHAFDFHHGNQKYEIPYLHKIASNSFMTDLLGNAHKAKEQVEKQAHHKPTVHSFAQAAKLLGVKKPNEFNFKPQVAKQSINKPTKSLTKKASPKKHHEQKRNRSHGVSMN